MIPLSEQPGRGLFSFSIYLSFLIFRTAVGSYTFSPLTFPNHQAKKGVISSFLSFIFVRAFFFPFILGALKYGQYESYIGRFCQELFFYV